jgi:purine-nucleoside phosphorylase
MLEKINTTCNFIRQHISRIPETGIILGTGLGELVNEIHVETTLKYSEIPNFPVSTVEGHSGQLVFGTLSGKPVVAMQGRFHYYEGYSMQQITFPVRVMKMLGIRLLIASNATGGVNPSFHIGDIMLITDHINLMGDNPLMGINIPELGTRFPDMSETYDLQLVEKAEKIARKHNLPIQKGVLAAVSGPCFETPAEYRYLRTIGADAVGMSVIPEAIAAKHMNLRFFALSVISDLGVEGKITEVSHQEVLEAAAKVEPALTFLIKKLLEVVV